MPMIAPAAEWDTLLQRLKAIIPEAFTPDGRILNLIDRLPGKERQALLLSAVEELSTVQIAAVLGTTESSIRSRIFRARRELSALLEKEGVSR